MSLLSDISVRFNDNTLLEIVRKCGGETIKSWSFCDGFKKGDSYLSDVRRFRVVGLDKNNCEIEINTVIKSLPKNRARCLTFRSPEFFAREEQFYNTIWAAFQQFQEKYQIPEPFTGIPRCLAAYVDGFNDFIVLEDLSNLGYKSGDRQKGFDVDHCRLAIENLGTFHALSLAMKQLEPKIWAETAENLIDIYHSESNRKWYEAMASVQIAVARDAIHREYPNTEIEKKALEFTDANFYSNMIQMTHTVNKFSVVNHGDCWLPNFLMLYDQSNQPQSAKLIDFQLARLTSPALDISFFIYSCTDEEMREKHYDSLLKHYHNKILAMLKQFDLGPDTFSFSDLEAEMREFARFGVGMGMESVPLSIIDETTDLDLIEGEEPLPLTEVWLLKNIPTQEGRRRLADIFKHAIKHKYL